MTDIYIHGKRIESVFQLLGDKENDVSFSVGWALAEVPSLLRAFVRGATGWSDDFRSEDVEVRLQRHDPGHGFTDFEIEYPGRFYLIVEAKRGWAFPEQGQVDKYAGRSDFRKFSGLKAIIVLSECDRDFSESHYKIVSTPSALNGTISWKDVHSYSTEALRHSTPRERFILGELNKYLESIMTMQNKDSNQVYVVALAGGGIKGASISHRDTVDKKLVYWHPVGGNGWPKTPVNYLAFRYDGKLQSIHYVRRTEVFTDPHKIVKEVPSAIWEPHFAYYLDKGFKPSDREVRTGSVYPSGRVWVDLDTLFTSGTIAEARDTSKRRRD